MAGDALKAALLERAKRERAARQKPEADMSLMGRIKDNVIGVDDGVMSVGEKIATGLNVAGESMTLGLVGDEAAAAFDVATGRGRYEDRLNRRRQQEAQFRQENPKTAFVAEVAPALIPGVGGAGIAAKATTALGRAGAGAALGAGAGATYGFMEGQGGAADRASNAGVTAALGALVGGAAPKVMDALGSLPKRLQGAFRRSQQRPTIEALKATKTAAYRAVDQSGEKFTGDEMAALSQAVSDVFEANNYVEEVDNAARAVLKNLEKRAGKPTTLSQLDGLRQNMWARYAGAKDQPVILDAIKAIDELIESRAGASELMGAARAANARYAKTQLLHDAFEKAQDQTSGTGSGGNILNKYRQAVTSIINNEKKARFFSAEEIALMREFVRGTPSENAKRLIGKLSPSGNGLMMALHVIGGVTTQGASVPLMAVGAAAKSSADRGAMRGADAIQDVLSGFRPVPQAPQLTRAQSALITGATPAVENASQALRRTRGRSR